MKRVVARWVGRAIGAGIITLLFVSCGAKYHLSRAIAKDPTILEQVAVKVDTTIITENKALRDTLILKSIDTIGYRECRLTLADVGNFESLS